MERADVLVVGAGPAGTTVAAGLAARGHDVLVVEEHGRVGHPVQCAGLVSQRVLDLAGSQSMVLDAVAGASVFGPSLGSVSFTAEGPRAFVIDRAGLDVLLADKAARSGARFATGVRFDRVVASRSGPIVAHLTDTEGRSREIEAKVVVGADGVASAVARAFRLRRPVEVLPAFEAEIPRSPGDARQVEVYLGNEISPGLFGWWIPDGSGGARVGVAASAGPVTARAYYDRLIRQVERRFRTTLPGPTAMLVSGIPIGTLPKTSTDRAILVGDAAAQVKPLSGGGIFTGMRCATIAVDVLDRALRAGDLSAAALADYDRAWQAELGEEFRQALFLRRLFVRLSDADLDRLIEALQGSDLKASIVAFGDIDFPTHVARKLLRQSPSLLRLFPKAVSAWLGGGPPVAPDLEPGPRRSAQ
ncbi:MAG: NAD(P)/FAD-dependent oxidoreductase [Thermoplasmata archaeon]|nr:NAD(P)/FAD-dependent oxidoreductase [Thermoplasmata archaeon]